MGIPLGAIGTRLCLANCRIWHWLHAWPVWILEMNICVSSINAVSTTSAVVLCSARGIGFFPAFSTFAWCSLVGMDDVDAVGIAKADRRATALPCVSNEPDYVLQATLSTRLSGFCPPSLWQGCQSSGWDSCRQ